MTNVGPLTDPFLTHPQGDFWYRSKLLLSLRRRRVWVVLGVRPAEGEADVLDWFVGENLNRKPWFLPSNIGLSCNLSHLPILWSMDACFKLLIFNYNRLFGLAVLSSMRGSAICCHPTSQPRTKPGTLRHRSEDTAIGYRIPFSSVPIDPADFSKICCQRSSWPQQLEAVGHLAHGAIFDHFRISSISSR
jgi:hypothetical protein